jgi:hypothetical protein
MNQTPKAKQPINILCLVEIAIFLLPLQGERWTGDRKIDGGVRQTREQFHRIAYVRSAKGR